MVNTRPTKRTSVSDNGLVVELQEADRMAMGHFATEGYRNGMAYDFYCDLFQHPYTKV